MINQRYDVAAFFLQKIEQIQKEKALRCSAGRPLHLKVQKLEHLNPKVRRWFR